VYKEYELYTSLNTLIQNMLVIDIESLLLSIVLLLEEILLLGGARSKM